MFEVKSKVFFFTLLCLFSRHYLVIKFTRDKLCAFIDNEENAMDESNSSNTEVSRRYFNLKILQ